MRATAGANSFRTTHAYVTAVTGLLADRAPGLLRTLREHEPRFVTDPAGEVLRISPALPGCPHDLTAARSPVERGAARLKFWRIFRRPRISPQRMTVSAKAVLTLER